MSRWSEIYRQLKSRRVIRAVVVYFAVFWLALQVADLLVESGLATEQQMRWLIIGGLALLPMTLVLSWFFEHPWHERAGLALLGDLALIITVAVASGLLAWQQWSKFTERPVVAILGLTPTDTHDSTRAMAGHLAGRLQLLLGTTARILVIDLESSLHPDLQALPVTDKAALLGADFLLTGTINQSNLKLRINIQLFDSEGELLWSDRFGDRIIDQFQLQSSLTAGAWQRLGLPESDLVPVREFLHSCEYPADREAILEMLDIEQRLKDMEQPDRDALKALITAIDPLLRNVDEAGLVFLARARVRERLLAVSEPTRQPVEHRLLAQDLEEARVHCPAHPGIELMRLLSSRELEGDADPGPVLARYPNSFPLRERLARINQAKSDPGLALQYAAQAYALNPLHVETWCRYRTALLGHNETAPQDRVAELDLRMARLDPTIQCRPGIEY